MQDAPDPPVAETPVATGYRTLLPLARLRALVGQEVGVSHWVRVDQPMIDAFATLTGDRQFIHVDPVRAAAEAPFGGTVAHGFLSVSLLSGFAYAAQPGVAEAGWGVNYGFDRLRFLAPVPAGARLRARFVLAALDESRAGEVTLHWDATMEIEGAARPALVARWITRQYLAGAA